MYKNIKNKYEIHGDIALIYVNSKNSEQILIVDADDLELIDLVVKNRINIDSGGYAQHRKFENGEWKTFQLHRELAVAFDWETVSFKNNNKLDLRWENLVCKMKKNAV